MKKKLIVILTLILLLSFTTVWADDLADVQKSGVLRLGTMQAYIPFVFTADNGTMDGMDVALVKEIGRRMGVEVQVISMAFDGLIDALELGQIDIIGGGFAKTEDRQKEVDFTRVYYTADSQFIGLKNLNKPQTVSYDSFHDLKIGVQKGTSFDQWVKTNLVNAGYVSSRNVYTYSSAAEEMKALDRGDVDLVVLSQDIYEDLYQQSGKYQIFYDGFMKESYAFGLRKNSTLTSVVSGHLTDMIKDGTAQSIANRYFQMNFNEASADSSRSSSVPTPTAYAPIVVVPTVQPSSCKNGMTFVSDVTITDGHQVSRGESFRKTWRVQNTGTCPWTTNYTFVFVSGDQMSGRNINVPYNVQPGQTVDLSVDLIAPNSDGTYRGYWQMRSPQGQNFGESIWVKVRVKGGSAGNDPVINAFYPNYYQGEKGTCQTVYWQTSNAAMIEIKVDGNSMVKSYTVNGSQNICGPLQSVGTHTVELAALSSSKTTYKSFTYTTNESGQKPIIPQINYFYASPESGYTWDSTTVYWSVTNAGAVDISVDGRQVQRSYDATGAISLSSQFQNAGTHSITLTAHSVTDDASSTVYYESYEGQVMTLPEINYFYVNPDSGYVWDSTTAYWSVSNADSVDISVDGYGIQRSYDATGAITLSAPVSSEGTHSITLTAHSVTNDVTSTVYYQAYQGQVMPDIPIYDGGGDDGQTRVIPSIDYFYVSPDSGYMGDSTTAYWSVSNAGGIEVFVDGNPIYNGSDSTGSASISATIQSVGNHTVSIVAHSVTDDATQSVNYTTKASEEDGGGWAGMNYYDEDTNYLDDIDFDLY